jgi:hypothetical protein
MTKYTAQKRGDMRWAHHRHSSSCIFRVSQKIITLLESRYLSSPTKSENVHRFILVHVCGYYFQSCDRLRVRRSSLLVLNCCSIVSCWNFALNTKDLSFKPCSILTRRELAQLVVCGLRDRVLVGSMLFGFFTIYIYFFFIIWGSRSQNTFFQRF